jgi:excisionase family DNA binding protein
MEESKNDFIGIGKLIIKTNLSRTKIINLIKNDKLPAYRLGKNYFFKLSEVERFFNTKKI